MESSGSIIPGPVTLRSSLARQVASERRPDLLFLTPCRQSPGDGVCGAPRLPSEWWAGRQLHYGAIRDPCFFLFFFFKKIKIFINGGGNEPNNSLSPAPPRAAQRAALRGAPRAAVDPSPVQCVPLAPPGVPPTLLRPAGAAGAPTAPNTVSAPDPTFPVLRLFRRLGFPGHFSYPPRARAARPARP